MENEQLQKKVEWLDDQRSEAGKALEALGKRLAKLEEGVEHNQKTLGDFDKDLQKASTSAAKLKELEKQIATLEKNLKERMGAVEKDQKSSLKELEEELIAEHQKLEKNLRSFRDEIGEIDELQKRLTKLEQEDALLADRIAEANKAVDRVTQGEEQRQQAAKSLEESSAGAAKKLAEMQGDVATALQSVEKAVSKVEVVAEDQRKVQRRLDEVVEGEEKRRAAQQDFMQKASADQAARERTWLDWEKRFEAVEQRSKEVSERLKDLETVDLTLKRAQRTFDELIEKINRRVNELGEIQRLGEQRFRQEWSTFQADSQKRWSNFTLNQEEQEREAERQREKLAKQVTQIEDALQEMQDVIQHLGDQSENLLQAMFDSLQETLSENERFYDSLR